jgi:tryptophan-rich sensory protein
MDSSAWISLGAFVAVNFAAASSGGAFRPGAWYAALEKPSWTPPNWAFPVVWLVIFTFNIFAGWVVWQAAGVAALPALAVYAASLGLNAAWSWLFFGRRRMDLALIDLMALWVSIAVVMVMFAPISLVATVLLAPYLLWVAIAGFLNLRMIQINRVKVRAKA